MTRKQLLSMKGWVLLRLLAAPGEELWLNPYSLPVYVNFDKQNYVVDMHLAVYSESG
jgi:hypothetical protein